MDTLRLLDTIQISGHIVVLTGLTIGGTDTFGIGGIDKQVVKDPLRGNRPYIPGSSLKGKMRSLVELSRGMVTISENRGTFSGEVHHCAQPDCPVCTVFGGHDSREDARAGRGPTRLVVRDAFLLPDSAAEDFFRATGRWVDLKTENVIDRLQGTAKHPRTFERVPPGMMFDLDMVYRVFARERDGKCDDGKRDLANLDLVREGLWLLVNDYLGASGSRGYGRICIHDVKLTPVAGEITLEPDATTWELCTGACEVGVEA